MSSSQEEFEHAIIPETIEGASCVNRAFKAGGKNFVFLGEKDGQCTVRLKLSDSVPEIEALAETDPDHWQVGKAGWALFSFPPNSAPPISDLQRWITESFHLLAPKKVQALLES